MFGIHIHLALLRGILRRALNSQHHCKVVPLRKSKNFRVGIEVRNIRSSVVSDPSRPCRSVACWEQGLVVARLRDILTRSGYVGRFVLLELCRPGELVAALLAEAVYSGAEIGSEQAGCSRISGARSACLTSSSREARWYGDRRNVREAVVETLQNAERVGINDCKRQPSACEGRARKYPSPSNALGPNLWGTL